MGPIIALHKFLAYAEAVVWEPDFENTALKVFIYPFIYPIHLYPINKFMLLFGSNDGSGFWVLTGRETGARNSS